MLGFMLIAAAYVRWPLWPDHSLYLYMGSLWHEGYLPYRDLFDQNWPGIIWLSQLVQYVLGDSPSAMRYFDLAWQACSCFILFRIARKEINQSLAWWVVSLYVLLYFSASYGGTAQREGFASLFLGGAMLCLGGGAGAFVSGLLIGVAILIKPTLLVVSGLICLTLCLSLVKQWNRERFFELIGLAFGTACVLIGLVFFLASKHLLRDFFDAAIVFAATYSGVSFLWVIKRAAQFFVLYPPGRLAVVIALLLVLSDKRQELFKNSRLLFVFTFGVLLSLLAQKRLAYYHAMPFCYFGSLLVFKLIAANSEKLRKLGLSKTWTLALPLLMVFPVGYDLPKSILSIIGMRSSLEYSDTRRAQRNLLPWRAINDVRKAFLEDIGDNVKVIVISGASSTDLYYAANRPPVQKYISSAHFLFDGSRLNEALAAIRDSKSIKAVIVDSAYQTLPTELREPLSAFMKEIFRCGNGKKVFSKSYGDAKIDIYLVDDNAPLKKV